MDGKAKLLFLKMDLEPVCFISLFKVGHFHIILLIIRKKKILSPQMGNNNGSEKVFLRGKNKVSNSKQMISFKGCFFKGDEG